VFEKMAEYILRPLYTFIEKAKPVVRQGQKAMGLYFLRSPGYHRDSYYSFSFRYILFST
jgi:hypothetical protein